MNAVDHDLPARAATTGAGAVRGLLRWYRPYLRGQRQRLSWVAAGSLVVLACQALIPWIVEVLLHHGHWDTVLVAVLLGLVLLQLIVSYRTHIAAHTVANLSSLVLSSRVYERLLNSRLLRQQGMVRSSIVVRLTADVGRVGDAVETTLADGLPSVGRLIVSLALLTVIEWRAGIAMTVASLAFIVVRRRIGRRMLVVDRERLSAETSVTEIVDETITNSRALTGVHLLHWQVGRFHRQSHELEHRVHEQGVATSRLLLAAHAAALTGLLVVVLFALVAGGENLASVAAALLYVEGAVRALEALPGWMREVQFAGASQHRLDEVLQEPDRVTTADLPDGPEAADGMPAGLTLADVTAQLPSGITLTAAQLTLPRDQVVGLVTPPGTEPDDVLELLSGDAAAASGRVTLDGRDVRHPEVAREVFLVPHDAGTFPASFWDLATAVDPALDEDGAAQVLARVGLDDILALPDGVRQPLGPGGVELTLNERQRLMLAVALAAQPRVLLTGSLISLADVDTALPLLDSLREGGQHTTVVCVRTAEVAEAVDLVLFIREGRAILGTHRELLLAEPAYADLWERRLATVDVDLSVVGIDASDEARMMTRLVTEHYSPGDVVYRQGSPADRIVFIISGHVEITTTDASGASTRVAVLGPGNHCGDLRLTVGERRAENAVALDDCVVRSLSRQAIQAGLTGLLDRTAAERRIVETLLRSGPSTRADLQERLPGLDPATLTSSLALLVRDGAVRDEDGVVTAVLQRSTKTGARELLDRLGDL